MPFHGKGSKQPFKKQFFKGPKLTPEEFERAKKEKLCFKCMSPNHSVWNCTKNKSKGEESRDKGKGKEIHVVQTLTLQGNEKFKSVEVLHEDRTHQCCVSTAMWQSTFGPHELVKMHGLVKGKWVRVMIDDSATHNFMNYALVKKLKIPQLASAHHYVVSMMHGEDKKIWDTMVSNLEIKVQGFKDKLDFQIMNMERADLVLGREWLWGLGPSLKRSYQQNSLEIEKEGKVYVIQGEHNVENSPLICSLELQKLVNQEACDVFMVWCEPIVHMHSLLKWKRRLSCRARIVRIIVSMH